MFACWVGLIHCVCLPSWVLDDVMNAKDLGLCDIVCCVRGELAGRKDVFKVLHPYVSDSTISMQQRMAVLELLEKVSKMYCLMQEGMIRV